MKIPSQRFLLVTFYVLLVLEYICTTRESILQTLCQIQWQNSTQIPASFFDNAADPTKSISSTTRCIPNNGNNNNKKDNTEAEKQSVGGYEWFFRKRIANGRLRNQIKDETVEHKQQQERGKENFKHRLVLPKPKLCSRNYLVEKSPTIILI